MQLWWSEALSSLGLKNSEELSWENPDSVASNMLNNMGTVRDR